MITLFDDVRVAKTLQSLQKQTRTPDGILIADGGSPKEFQQYVKNIVKKRKNIEFSVMPGRCIDTRRQVIDRLMNETEVVSFIDSDQDPYIDWLEKLIAPIENGEADFVGGKTIPTTAKTNAERILNIIQFESQEMYDEDISYIAMGNSAWKMDVFKKIGNFDDSSVSTKTDKDYIKGKISGSYHVSDDYDINIRAVKAGFKGVFAKDAQVLHDQSHVDNTKKLIRYFHSQFVRTSMAYFKHHVGIKKFTKGTKGIGIAHPFQLFLFLIKPIALTRGWMEWNKLAKIRGVVNE